MFKNDSHDNVARQTEMLSKAFDAHQAGDFEMAEGVYKQILCESPMHLDANQLLGALLIQRHRPEESIQFLSRAISIDPTATQCRNNLAVAYSKLGRIEDSVSAYRLSLEIDPSNFETLRNLGRHLAKLKQFSDAVHFLKRALELKPDDWNVRVALGVALHRVDRDAEALHHLEQVLQSRPLDLVALKAAGQILLKTRGASARAIEVWHRLVELEPENAAFHNNLASVLKQAERYDEAKLACERALNLLPEYFPALCNLGLILSIQELFSASITILQRAVIVDETRRNLGMERYDREHPEYALLDGATWDEFAAVAYCQLAAIRNLLGDTQEAQLLVSKGLKIKPNHVDCHMMQAFLYLQSGRYEPGWTHYEWRKRGPNRPREFEVPEWKGQHCPEMTVLLHTEQGLGDTIQFVRYAAQVKQKFGTVLLQCQPSLVPLIKSCEFLDHVFAEGEPLPDFDYHVPLLSLPFVCKTSLESVPRNVPYLSVPKELNLYWKDRLERFPGFRIGVAWQGNRAFAYDSLRRIQPEFFRSMAELPGVRLVCLQKGEALAQLSKIDFEIIVLDELDENSGAFMDTAAVMNNLDLIVSPCTATTHVAGALARPVWLAKSFAAEWRWMCDDRIENPWYPTMRMFRQPSLGDWPTVFRRMTAELQSLVNRQ